MYLAYVRPYVYMQAETAWFSEMLNTCCTLGTSFENVATSDLTDPAQWLSCRAMFRIEQFPTSISLLGLLEYSTFLTISFILTEWVLYLESTVQLVIVELDQHWVPGRDKDWHWVMCTVLACKMESDFASIINDQIVILALERILQIKG